MQSLTIAIGIRYDTIFTYCSWVSARWQRSVNLYKNWRQLCTKGETKHKKYENAEYTKKEKEHKMNIIKLNFSNKISKRANNDDTTYCTEHTYSYRTINQ